MEGVSEPLPRPGGPEVPECGEGAGPRGLPSSPSPRAPGTHDPRGREAAPAPHALHAPPPPPPRRAQPAEPRAPPPGGGASVGLRAQRPASGSAPADCAGSRCGVRLRLGRALPATMGACPRRAGVAGLPLLVLPLLLPLPPGTGGGPERPAGGARRGSGRAGSRLRGPRCPSDHPSTRSRLGASREGPGLRGRRPRLRFHCLPPAHSLVLGIDGETEAGTTYGRGASLGGWGLARPPLPTRSPGRAPGLALCLGPGLREEPAGQ